MVLAQRLEMCVKLANTVLVRLVGQFGHSFLKLLRVPSVAKKSETDMS